MSFKKVFFVFIFLAAVLYAPHVGAANVGDVVNFNVDANFEKNENSQVQAVLVKSTTSLHFYIEKDWWNAQVPVRQTEVLNTLENLSVEFTTKTYPTLTSVFGQEWNPGVDGDSNITILLHSMKENFGGYFRSHDEFIKLQIPNSNEREMVYLPVAQVDNLYRLKVFLAHEFVHMITFNQKERLRGVQEDVWLNEARAEYAITVLGYNSIYEGSNLQGRVRDFLEKPSDSLTEWLDSKYDYGSINLFTHYLADHYGINILSDSLKLKSTGIASINEMLQKGGYTKKFADIFTDWAIANVINNCTGEVPYCYLSPNLRGIRISPTLNFLPLVGNSSLSVTNVIKNWAGNWQKIIGGNGNLLLEFSGLSGVNFKVPYIIFDKENNYIVNFLNLDQAQKGDTSILGFGEKYNSLVIIPLLETKTAGFLGAELTYPYTFKISIFGQISEDDPALIEKLLAKIESLKQQIAALQSGVPSNPSCGALNNNLYFGVKNTQGVTCLQTFLKSQGIQIYPEGLVTGNFGSLTRTAVLRFQAKYGITQTGFVGVLTRAKINSLLK